MRSSRRRSVKFPPPASTLTLEIDAEGTLTPQLMARTAADFAHHNSRWLQFLSSRFDAADDFADPPSTVEEVRRGIHYSRVYDLAGLLAFFQALPEWLCENPLVRVCSPSSSWVLTSHCDRSNS